MTQEVIMPKLGLAMTHGRITRWHKHEGEQVKAGEVIVEIETDKINSDVESPVDGYIVKILAAEGEERGITVPICIVGSKEEVGNTAAGDIKYMLGSKPVEKAGAGIGPRVRISPLAKRIAAENSLDFANIAGTGPEGRIIKKDIFAAIKQRNQPVQPERLSGGYKAEDTAVQSKVITSEAGRIPFSSMRKSIAARLSQSKREIPHVYFKVEIDATGAMELKKRISDIVIEKTGKKLTFNDIVIKAVALALPEFYEINASFADDGVIYHNNINIGMAVSVENGLIVPVIKNADRLGLSEINRIAGELAEKARNKKLMPEDVNGGSLTVSNLGAYGIDEFYAVINPHESAILAVGAIKEMPCVENGQVVARLRTAITLSVDHRLIDGVLAAKFLKRLKELLEEPYKLII